MLKCFQKPNVPGVIFFSRKVQFVHSAVRTIKGNNKDSAEGFIRVDRASAVRVQGRGRQGLGGGSERVQKRRETVGV